ncbi:PoNe immunity protein domain-containing protein [Thioclava sp. GXIMD4216]|uniref:PoNe immunity protein domain-containing protein n=1 Tax=Thioclava sp. GXIMD4216 TaxID=3131929 RepID=UPI0030CFB620
MRDKLASPEFWVQALTYQVEDIEAFEKSYGNPSPGPLKQGGKGYPLLQALFETSLCSYSAGAPMPEVVAPGLHGVGHLFPEMVSRFGTEMPDGIARDGYDDYLRYISMLVLCCANQDEFKAFFDALDQFDLTKRDYGGYDQIWSAFRRQLGQGDVAPQSSVHWPEAYHNLWLAIDPEEPDFARPHHLGKFLKGWYDEMATELAAQTTRAEDLGENSTYVGYWCLEAAAASVAFGIDDTQLRDHPHYPADWADWARNCRPLA